MNKNIVVGTLTFGALNAAFGLSLQALLEQVGATSAMASQLAAVFIVIPLALIVGRRVGRVTHLSVLVASLVLAVTTLWAIVFIHNSIAEPVGGHVGWGSLFTAEHWVTTVLGAAAMIIAPQIWLLVLNRLAANSSSKPTPLRGAA